MRIRTVKPEWLEDEKLASASDEARVLSVGLILMADDHGRARASIATIAATVWRYQLERDGGEHAPEVLARASRALHECIEIGFVHLYEVNGQRYYAIRNWSKHQRVAHPGKPLVPPPADDENTEEEHDSRGPRGVLVKPSGEPHETLMPDHDHDHDQDQELLQRASAREAEAPTTPTRSLRDKVADQVATKPTPGSVYKLLELLSALHSKPGGAPHIEPGATCSSRDRAELAKVIQRAEARAPDLEIPPMAMIANEWTALIALVAAQEVTGIRNGLAYFARCFGDLERNRAEMAVAHVTPRTLEAVA